MQPCSSLGEPVKTTVAQVAGVLAACCLAVLAPSSSWAEESGVVSSCLKSWGSHPFGAQPRYRTLATSVKVFGIGQGTTDTVVTDKPELILVNPGINVMGGSTIELLNPNGWYCFRSNVNVMGGMTIRAHCKARIASGIEGVTVASNNAEGKAVTVMGSTVVERVGCP